MRVVVVENGVVVNVEEHDDDSPVSGDVFVSDTAGIGWLLEGGHLVPPPYVSPLDEIEAAAKHMRDNEVPYVETRKREKAVPKKVTA